MLLHCTVDSLGKTIRSVPAGHEPKLHGQKYDKDPCGTGQLDAAGCRKHHGTLQTQLWCSSESRLGGKERPQCMQAGRKKTNPCRQMRNQSDFLKSMCVSVIANSWYLEASESNLGDLLGTWWFVQFLPWWNMLMTIYPLHSMAISQKISKVRICSDDPSLIVTNSRYHPFRMGTCPRSTSLTAVCPWWSQEKPGICASKTLQNINKTHQNPFQFGQWGGRLHIHESCHIYLRWHYCFCHG